MSKAVCMGIAAGLGITLSAATVHAKLPKAGSWQVIGKELIQNGTASDDIFTPGSKRYQQVKICAFNAPLNVRDIDVFFGNGRQQDAGSRGMLAPDRCTRSLKLQGAPRRISHVRIRYERTYRGTRAPMIRIKAR